MKNNLLQGYRIINTWMGDPAKVILLDSTLKVIREQNLLENAKVVGKQLLDGLVSLEVGMGYTCITKGWCRDISLLGLVYYHISNAMQYSNTALEANLLVMHDPNTCFPCGATFSYNSANFINIHNIS